MNTQDAEIAQLEAELRESRIKPWDVEKLLIERHEARIEALTKPANKMATLWEVTKEVSVALFALIGMQATAIVLGVWLLTGELPFAQLTR